MRRRVAICNFILADYLGCEGQEGIGLHGETPPADLSDVQKAATAVESVLLGFGQVALLQRVVPAAAFIRCRPF